MAKYAERRGLIYNFAFGVSSASDSSYILSSSARNFFAVWGRLSLSLFIVSTYLSQKGIKGPGTYVGVKSSFSIVNGSTSK